MKFLFLLSVVALASSATVGNDDSVSQLVLDSFVDCLNSDVTLCLKEKALKATDRLRTVRQIDLVEGVTLFNNAPAKEGRSLELSAEPELRKQQVTERLWESASDVLQNGELELSWSGDEDDEEESRAIEAEESRGKKKKIKKKLKLLLPLLLIAKAKAAAIVVASIVIIAISIAKIAALAKIAFIAKAIAIIKYLLHKKHATEEIIIPHHEEHGHGWDQGGWDHGHSAGWSRRNDGSTLAYSAYGQQV